ncbi:hypothetical protein MATR_07290 [Marivirga tractuosa]|uniref:Uncharacterized protein n=1 Tax=Marivirga tractuosa (strain ATCC 23168 / DSM 4126 / NBRC 15989 / NCIMB 1408 / VKM B-1430 / H-43) TaxID=643867 RepID=E4TQT9_MARTH|nr:hypothetical protein [Marivirga tractuosa]ADR21639.1 hypothetical protein Ftrac_1651 [Marivirga tractuosa DSM 4126]BDD13904.1 hypothetical protein MATR_07290 [Marivirga tractuosa]
MEKEIDNIVKLLDEEYAEVNYSPEMQLAWIKWKGNVSVEQYRNAFETIYKYAVAGNLVKRFYSDTREQGVVGPENRKWFEKEMLPKAIDQGLEKAGVVSDANVFKRYYLNMILKSVNKFNMPFKICGSDEDVIAFLMED